MSTEPDTLSEAITPALAARRDTPIAASGRGLDLVEADEPDVAATFLTEATRGRVRHLAPMLLLFLPLVVVVIPKARAPWLQIMAWVSLAVHATTYLWLLWVTRSPQSYAKANVAPVGSLLSVATIPLTLLFGAESLFTAVLAVALVLHCAESPPRYALISIFALGSTQLASEVALHMGWMSSPGFEAGPSPEERTPILNAVAIIGIYTLCFLAGQGMRRRSARTATALERAVRQIAIRTDRLRMARAELEQALSAGQPGRFTGLELGDLKLGVLLGRGGMGDVYEATTAGGEERAVKVLRSEAMSVGRVLERFLQEAKVAASIDSPHVVRIYEVGGLEAPVPFLSMERLRGDDLDEILESSGPLSATEAESMVLQIGAGLSAAHERSVVHRDVKPSNVVRCEDGTWKLLDFGIARVLDDAVTVAVVGTPMYMAPEQVLDPGSVDARADVCSFAKLAYEAITGAPPVQPTATHDLSKAMLELLPARPSSLVSVSEDVDAVLRIGMAKSPDDRFQSLSELTAPLASVLSGAPAAPELRARAAELDRALTWAG